MEEEREDGHRIALDKKVVGLAADRPLAADLAEQ